MESIIHQCDNHLERMYVEVPNNLADFDGYTPYNESILSSTAAYGIKKRTGKYKPLCDTSRKFIRPIIAQDINGSWYLIVQTGLYHQQIPVEMCK